MCPSWRSSDEFGVVVDSEKARQLSQRVVATKDGRVPASFQYVEPANASAAIDIMNNNNYS